ncbi:MAG: type II toxin-antitoxin system RelE/ParE family toxin [Acidobacteria bacterium]|nr:type II toxin-antitoxin system RelE/ParE family toxin [Acidobacteriota bacterium]
MAADVRVFQTARFEKQVRKLAAEQKRQLDVHVRKILADPQIGDLKRGDLAGVLVYKFHLQHQRYLLAYTASDNILTLLMLGPHENFYRDLKK